MHDSVIAQLSVRAAQAFGERDAVIFPGDRSLSFAQTEDLAGRFAEGLWRLGVKLGDRVVLRLPNSSRWMIAYYAIARLGAVVVPANILLSDAEVSFITADSEAGVLIGEASRLAALDVNNVSLISVGVYDGAENFDALLDNEWRAPIDISPDDLFTIGYTSGTTGRPKGAMLTHGNIFASVEGTSAMHERTGSDRIYSALPFPHVYGNVVVNSVFHTGASIIAASRFDAGEALAAIEKHSITLFEGVPTMYYQMLANPALEAANLTSLRKCTVGGQTMPLPLLERVRKRFDCPVLELWGMTELGGPATSHAPSWPPHLGSIGKPLPGIDIRIADLQSPGKDAPLGQAGELMARGPLVMQGYWKRPDATAETIRNGWLATGDVAHIDSEGYITIVDRLKDMIITAGYNVYPAELEAAICAHPAVSMAAVAGVPDVEKGELAHAFVVLRPGQSLEAEALLLHCRKILAAYKIPKAVHFVNDLPTTSTGKIMRRALRDGVQSQNTDGGRP